MRKLITTILVLISLAAFSQGGTFNANGKLVSGNSDSALTLGQQISLTSDTTKKFGFATISGNLWFFDKAVGYWKPTASSGITSIAKGGTSSSTASVARDSLGVPYAKVYDLVGKFIIACWGDSFTQGAGSSGGANLDYPNQLSNISGFSNYNGGIGGQSSGQIRDRMLADIPKHGYPTIIWAGRNDYTDTTNVKTYINDMVLALGNNPNYIVLSILNGSMGANEMKGGAGYNTIIALNKALERAYGSHYVDVRKTLVEAYNPAIPYDVYCYNQDIPPLSLRGDSLHLNDAGYLVVAKKVFENLSQLTNPVVHVGSINYLLKNPLKLNSTLQVDSTLTVLREINSGAISVTGGITSSGTREGFRINDDNAYVGFHNGAGTTRTGYLQFNAGGDVLLNGENSSAITIAGAPVKVLNQNFSVAVGSTLLGSDVDAGTGKLQVTGNASIVGNTNIVGNETVNGVLTVNNSGTLVNAGGDNNQYAIISGANKTLSNGGNSGQLFIVANDPTPSANFGGSIGFGATYANGTSAVAINAAIRSGREDGVSGNYGGYFAIHTRPNGGNILERFRITPSGNTLIGSTTDAGTGKLQVEGNASITGVVKYSFATLTADANIFATNTNVTGGTNFTLPDATVNAGVEYTIINSTSGTLNINAAMSQLIGNFTTSTTFSMLTETSNTFLSNGTKWLLK